MKKIYLIALVLALLTGISVYSFAGALEKTAKREYADIVTAAVVVPERTALTAEMLVMKSIPVEAILPNAIRSIDKAVGLYTDSALEPGEYLSSSKLHVQGDNSGGLTYFVANGKRAFTINVDAMTGVGGFILPGDHVDILANMVFEEGEGDKKKQVPTSLIVLQNVEIMAAGASIRVQENGEDVTYSTVTLSLTPEESVKLNLANASGKLRLILRSPIDKDIVVVKPQTNEMLMG